eukprot:scaffold5351_cov199-Alexandrium_tamarense.AAC.27
MRPMRPTKSRCCSNITVHRCLVVRKEERRLGTWLVWLVAGPDLIDRLGTSINHLQLVTRDSRLEQSNQD